jgi:monoamine oxidase
MPIPIDRREFLKLGLLAASAQLAPPRSWDFTPQALPHAASPKKVLVVGAGLAGLVAAYELTQAGHDVTVLEAQLRPGGRVQTVREPFSDGLYTEAGAARIPDNHDLTLHYAKHFGLTLVPFFPNNLARVFRIGGKRIKSASWTDLDLSQVPLNLTAEERRMGMAGLLQKYLGDALNDIGDPRATGWPNSSAKKYDSMTMAEFLKQRGASHGAIELLEYPYASAEDDPVSLLWNLRDDWYPLRETTRYKIDGGNDKLPKAFAERLKEKIHYGSPVVRIEQDSSRVRATVVRSGTHQSFEADRLICAVPFPPLRRVEVQPPFSERRRKAIAELRYDPVTRVILQCRSRFWEKDGCNGFGVSDLPQEIFHTTFDQPGTRGLLASYMLVGVGQRASAMDPTSRIRFVVQEMEKVHPGLLDNLEGSCSKVWPTDPWAGGAGSQHSPGQLTTLCVGMEQPEGRVHFAGEHLSAWPYWMQGALQSGLRAAKEVNQASAKISSEA